MGKNMNNELAASEKTQLRELETIISRTKDSFMECGLALGKIRDGRLYRENFGTFETYCEKTWGWKRSQAYRLIAAAEIKLSPMGDKVANERQARELAKIPEKERAKIMQTVEEKGIVTAKTIRETVESAGKNTVRLDYVGRKIPAKILSEWDRAEAFAPMIRQISQIKCTVKAGRETDLLFCEILQATVSDLENIFHSLKQLLPYAVCPICRGQATKNCIQCKGRGFISEFLWKTVVPEELKK